MDEKLDDLNPILSKITRPVTAIKSLRFALLDPYYIDVSMYLYSLVGYMGFRAKTPVLTSSGGNKFLKALVSEAMKTPLTHTSWNLLSWNSVFTMGWFGWETETFLLNNVVVAIFKFYGYVIKYLIDSIPINQWKALFQYCSLPAIETL